MLVILLEALAALVILLLIVWWTMFSGRPKGERVSTMSVSMTLDAVQAVLGKEVMFVPEIAGDVVRQAIGILQPGDIAMLENTRFWAPLSLSPEQKHSLTDPVAMEQAADALPLEEVTKRWIVSSDPDETVELVKPYVDAGFTHLVFHAPGDDPRRFLTAFEEDLAPRLRAASARASERPTDPRDAHDLGAAFYAVALDNAVD